MLGIAKVIIGKTREGWAANSLSRTFFLLDKSIKLYTVHLGYNDVSLHAEGIVTNRISVHQDSASMFHAKITCQDDQFQSYISQIS